MVQLIILAFINSLLITGLYEATAYSTKGGKYNQKDSNILGWFAFKGDKLLPHLLREPLWLCRLCMSSFHSTYVYWGYRWLESDLNLESMIIYPCYVLMLAGMNVIMGKIID